MENHSEMDPSDSHTRPLLILPLRIKFLTAATGWCYLFPLLLKPHHLKAQAETYVSTRVPQAFYRKAGSGSRADINHNYYKEMADRMPNTFFTCPEKEKDKLTCFSFIK